MSVFYCTCETAPPAPPCLALESRPPQPTQNRTTTRKPTMPFIPIMIVIAIIIVVIIIVVKSIIILSTSWKNLDKLPFTVDFNHPLSPLPLLIWNYLILTRNTCISAITTACTFKMTCNLQSREVEMHCDRVRGQCGFARYICLSQRLPRHCRRHRHRHRHRHWHRYHCHWHCLHHGGRRGLGFDRGCLAERMDGWRLWD